VISESAAIPEEIVKLHDDQYYIHVTSARLDDRTRVLKHGDTFAVFDRFGEIDGLEGSQFGIFHQDTRFLSRLALRLDRARLALLSSAIKQDNALLTVDLTNVDIERADGVVIPRGTLHVLRSIVLWNGACYERLRIHNYGRTQAKFRLSLHFGADFADIFEVRGMRRESRGTRAPTQVEPQRLRLVYDGLDGRRRTTRIDFEPRPTTLDEEQATFDLSIGPQDAVVLRWTVSCEEQSPVIARARLGASTGDPGSLRYETAAAEAVAALRAAKDAEPELVSSNEQFNEWWNRSTADLRILATNTAEGPYPYAGIPWFSTPFGRDGILTALASLWLTPDFARGVLGYLAANQAEADVPEQDAQPGKILHETRGGEMSALGEVPFARYYGSVDATPLFVMLAGAYHERTGDRAFIERLWPNVERALEWIDRYGDVDGDGFVEYARRSDRGLVHQGWKDSHDSVFHADGTLAEGPIALCEVQAYVYAAKRAAARLARLLGFEARARELDDEADRLRAAFDAAFWSEDLSTYVLALDGEKRPCRVYASNAGHCLFAGIALPERARRIVDVLMSEPFYTGWGIRTIASTEAAYNPLSYHNGSVWPHDNAIIAAGFARYGRRHEAGRILHGLLDASMHLELRRLPELFCGFTRRAGEHPTLYPTACSPQAWASSAPMQCLEACLGVQIHGAENRITFHNPQLPAVLERIHLNRLRVGEGVVDLLITRHGPDVDVTLLRRVGPVEVVVLKN
jgi:glycogen debranching enzyme